MKQLILYFSVSVLLISCQPQSDQKIATDTQQGQPPEKDSPTDIRAEVLEDKILGLLLGSAIGDAMGAPTEMWSRREIMIDYGYVNGLDTMVREPSAEGTWDYNLPAGGTTDDTRWKKLMANYLLTQNNTSQLDTYEFAELIIKRYEEGISELKNTESFDPEPYEISTRKLAWLQEWASVAKPFVEDDLQAYAYALSQFYGGEMTCAGMLYSPMIGAFYPSKPRLAYEEAYRVSLFDIGYARDISALTAAMVSAAMAPDATSASVTNVVRDVDPESYFKSRLVGRTAYRLLKEARTIVYDAMQLSLADVDINSVKMPKGFTDTLQIIRINKAYELLDAKTQDMPFHAGEIHLVNLTALLFCDFDFAKTLAFVVNFGRDNDTTAAVSGAILGAYWGASQLPKDMVRQVLSADSASIRTNFYELAHQLASEIDS